MYFKALDLDKESDNILGLSVVLNNIASTYLRLNDNVHALDFYERAYLVNMGMNNKYETEKILEKDR